jgi:hypothetical protein
MHEGWPKLNQRNAKDSPDSREIRGLDWYEDSLSSLDRQVVVSAPIITGRAAGREAGMGLGHAFASASRFRKASTPASDTSTHFRTGEASAS